MTTPFPVWADKILSPRGGYFAINAEPSSILSCCWCRKTMYLRKQSQWVFEGTNMDTVCFPDLHITSTLLHLRNTFHQM